MKRDFHEDPRAFENTVADIAYPEVVLFPPLTPASQT